MQFRVLIVIRKERYILENIILYRMDNIKNNGKKLRKFNKNQ